MNKQTRAQFMPPMAIETPEMAELFCGRFSKTIEALRDTIERETRHVRSMEIAEAEAAQTEKSVLAQAYLQEMTFAKTQRDLLAQLAPGPLKAVQEKHEMLRQCLLDNEIVLGALKSASQSLIRRAAERVAENAKPSTYSSAATTPRQTGAAAVALDRKL